MVTTAHIAATIQGHARRLCIEKLFATEDKDTHLVYNLVQMNILPLLSRPTATQMVDSILMSLLSRPTTTQMVDSILMSFVAWKVTAAFSFTMVRTIVSRPAHNSNVSKVTTLPCACALLPLALVVVLGRTFVLPSRMLVAAKMPVLVLTVTNRKFVVSKIQMSDLPVMNPWPRLFSKPVTGLSTWLGRATR
jgi:hypothetical protein